MFKEALIVLASAAVVIPVFHRLKLSPVLGFLLIGMVVGPFGLGALQGDAPFLSYITIADKEMIAQVAELGVVLLLFMIGLELSFERLRLMHRLVFGFGALQVLCCAALIAGVALAAGQPAGSAIVIGLALAMSSTAIIVQVLSENGKLGSQSGKTTFSALLFQDLAVVPVLFAVAMLADPQRATGSALALALGQAAVAIVGVIAAGRLVLRPLFRSVAATRSPELFMAACLLVVLGASVAMAAAGVSMALGALIAGLLLAETEYRRQIEVLIEPFKGLLLGVFLISIGMTIDLAAIAANPLWVTGGIIGLICGKGLVIFLLARAIGVAARPAAQSALVLAPGSEFSFVILTAALAGGVVSATAAGYAAMVAALTMALIPPLFQLGARLDVRATRQDGVDPALQVPRDLAAAPRVVVAGYGRVGAVIASMLDQHGVDWIAVDSDAKTVARAHRQGKPVYFGDLKNPSILASLDLADARALVVTMDAPKAVETVVAEARALRADLLIVARARDARHAAALYAAGASDAVPETLESSLLLSEALLVDIGVPMGLVIASIHEKRDEFRAEIKARSETPEEPLLGMRRDRARRLYGARAPKQTSPGQTAPMQTISDAEPPAGA